MRFRFDLQEFARIANPPYLHSRYSDVIARSLGDQASNQDRRFWIAALISFARDDVLSSPFTTRGNITRVHEGLIAQQLLALCPCSEHWPYAWHRGEEKLDLALKFLRFPADKAFEESFD